MNKIKTYQVHNNSSQLMKLLYMNFHEHDINWIYSSKFIKIIIVYQTLHMKFMN